MLWNIIGPPAKPNRITEQAQASQPQPAASSLAAAKYKAQIACENVDTLIRAADARRRTGTWQPGAAANISDHHALGAAQDIIDQHKRRRG